jgi:hypothetical protein
MFSFLFDFFSCDRSLVPKKIQIWYEDGQGGVEQGHLKLGQETTTNTYEGHVFYFTDFDNKEIVYGRFRMHKNQVLYVVQDPSFPAPKDILKYTENEVKYNEEYLAKNGIPWRHYYGPNGPRPPPVLFMWPARVIGETHSVTSSHGHW